MGEDIVERLAKQEVAESDRNWAGECMHDFFSSYYRL